jgi:hypothetical protein
VQDPSQIYPNWDFWFVNIPSGNPELEFGETPFKTIANSFDTGDETPNLGMGPDQGDGMS